MTTLDLSEDSINCPLCGSTMIWKPGHVIHNEKVSDMTVHSFVCSNEHREDCKCRWTAWDLKIIGMDSVEDIKLYLSLRESLLQEVE